VLDAVSPEPEWFPAIENRGEGVFVVLYAQTISGWRESDGSGAAEPSSSLARSLGIMNTPGSHRKLLGMPYIQLHSLSHLLLTRIAFECGYPAGDLDDPDRVLGRRRRGRGRPGRQLRPAGR
jgi:hypothetical protein